MHDVVGALHVEHGRHVDGLATIEDADGVAFLHRLLGAPELGVQRDHASICSGYLPPAACMRLA